MHDKLHTIMRKILILSFVLAASVKGFSQFDIKKDVLLKDKQPYAQITGTSKFMEPANLAVSSLNGDSLFTIKTWKYTNANPKFRNLFGYTVRFVGSGKSMVRLHDEAYPPTRKDKIYNLVVKGFTQDLVVNNAINPVAEAEFLKLDGAPTIAKAAEYEKSMADYLKAYYPIPRTTEAKVTLKNVKEVKEKDGSITRTQDAYQADVYLVTIVTRLTGEAIYTLQRKNDKPFVYGDEKLEEAPVAFGLVASSVFSYPVGNSFPVTIHSNVSEKDYEIKVAVPNKAEQEIAQYLVDNKLL